MKRIVVSFIAALCCITSFSQNDAIRMPERPNTHKFVDLSERTTGFWCTAGLSLSCSDADSKKACEAFADIVAGFRFNQFIRLGIGVSPRLYIASEDGFPKSTNTVEVPLYFDVRGNFFSQEHRAFSPYWSLDAGYTFACGAYVSPTIGFRFGGIRNDFLLGFSYVMQQYNYSVIPAGVRNMVCLKLAYEY